MKEDLINRFLSNLAKAVYEFVLDTPTAMHLAERAIKMAKTGKKIEYVSKYPRELMKERPRKKPPIQFCPVPRCKGRAAPVFGMVCAKHKDLPKKQIAAFREVRRTKANKKPGKKAIAVNRVYGKLGTKAKKTKSGKAKTKKAKKATGGGAMA